MRPLTLQLRELAAEPGRFDYQLNLALPPRLAPDNAPHLEWPPDCDLLAGEVLLQLARCSAPLYGRQLTLGYPQYEAMSPAVLRLNYLDGEEFTLTLSPGERVWQLPEKAAAVSVFLQYTWLGMEHIWIGYDHLLFLLCLIWIAGQLPRVLLVVTGFTLAHSLTLALAALDLVRLPVQAVEAVIALSVLFLATELVKGSGKSLAFRWPLFVSTSFGLLHGLGFAAVLREIGLPELQLITGLVAFNLGVEAGQAAFVLLVMVLLSLLRIQGRKSARRLTGYGVGILAGYWFIERMSGIF